MLENLFSLHNNNNTNYNQNEQSWKLAQLQQYRRISFLVYREDKLQKETFLYSISISSKQLKKKTCKFSKKIAPFPQINYHPPQQIIIIIWK